ncbi:Hsp20 family protein [Brevibacterium sp. 5221]|uniref:Hsp20 family protein n=1 Tax=Brevibacterium rongguiense TaxID=2695267 RepID=A0A6N9H5G7_9MICO|nr:MULTISPECIES: Hsp20/alpha crystallin family protein [Brevibacterium]MYM18912.1 Hsp20 family protein [Brevibacterium rongguiense]WAL40760.1 Hsp20/alpha crystallin family protein [Brevibacterium sp. BRM-1]
MAPKFEPLRDIDRFITEVARSSQSAALPMDLYRDGEVFIARIDMPGVDPSSIDVDVEDRTLTVRSERQPVSAEGVQWLTRERPTGTFARQLTLGSRVALDKISADFSDGVLTLTIPVSEEAKPRKIAVQHQAGRTENSVSSTATSAPQHKDASGTES